MSTLPLAVYTAAQVRALDRHAIEVCRIPRYTLMTRAGRSGARARCAAAGRRRSASSSSAVRATTAATATCSRGSRGRSAEVDRSSRSRDPARLQGDARTRIRRLPCGGRRSQRSGTSDCLARREVIVDAIFGIGLDRAARRRELRGDRCRSTPAARRCSRSIFRAGCTPIRARCSAPRCRPTRTMTFIGLKLGFYLGEDPSSAARHVRWTSKCRRRRRVSSARQQATRSRA